MSTSFLVRAALAVALLAASPAEGALYRDDLGREVTIPSGPGRIVSLAPNLTEILFSLDLERQVAGVTIFCDWPPAALEKPKVGGFINPSLEAIVALDPDLILATADGNRKEDVARLASLGKAVYVVDTRSVGEILAAVTSIGAITGRSGRADALVKELQRRRDHVLERVEDLARPKVFVALDRNPLITAGKGTFINELIILAGGENVVSSTTIKYPVFSMEELLTVNPEIIIAAAGKAASSREEAAARWKDIPGGRALGAVKKERVFELGMGSFFRPGPRIIDSLEALAEMIHPGVLK